MRKDLAAMCTHSLRQQVGFINKNCVCLHGAAEVRVEVTGGGRGGHKKAAKLEVGGVLTFLL